jgi:hypothetical protein
VCWLRDHARRRAASEAEAALGLQRAERDALVSERDERLLPALERERWAGRQAERRAADAAASAAALQQVWVWG